MKFTKEQEKCLLHFEKNQYVVKFIEFDKTLMHILRERGYDDEVCNSIKRIIEHNFCIYIYFQKKGDGYVMNDWSMVRPNLFSVPIFIKDPGLSLDLE